MSTRTFRGALAGTNFEFSADAADVSRYAAAHLDPLRAEATGAPEVSTTLYWHEGQPPQPPRNRLVDQEHLHRVDRDLYVGEQRLCWFRVDDLRDLHLEVSWRESHLTVRGDFYHRVGNGEWNDRLRRVIFPRQAGHLRRRRFTTLLSYLVYYPCWWWLEVRRQVHPIHAAGVSTPQGVVLLAGASGIGKSSLAVALAAMPGARLLSDSFVLHRGEQVHAVPEPILLDSWSRRWLGERGARLCDVAGDYGLGRQGYQLPTECRAGGGRAALLLFPERAAEPSVRRLSAEEAQDRLSAADLIINDLRRYWAFAAVLEHMQPAGLVARREAQIRSLAAAVPAYRLTLTADTSADEAVARVSELLLAAREETDGER